MMSVGFPPDSWFATVDREQVVMDLEERHCSAEIFQEWDLYDRIIQFNYMKHREMAEGVARTAYLLAAPCRVLDLGCGDGRMAARGLHNVPCESYHGIDLSGQAIEAARSNLKLWNTAVSFTRGDLAVASYGLAEQWRQGGTVPANILLASFSLHHLPRADVVQMLKTLSSAMVRPGLFCWIDLCMHQEETRRAYLERFYREELANWGALTQADVSAVVEHMEGSDFPLSEPHRLDVAAEAGFALREPLYRDDFYAAHLFELAS